MLKNCWERFAIPSCRLYHREVGIHTFELLYFFSGSDRYEQIERVWQFLNRECRRYAHNRYQFILRPGLRAETLNTSGGQRLKMLVNPRVMVHGELGYLGITDCRSDILTEFRFIFNDFWERQGTYDSLMEEMRLQKKMPELYRTLERYRQLGLSPTTLRKRSGRICMPSLFMLALYVLQKEFEK